MTTLIIILFVVLLLLDAVALGDMRKLLLSFLQKTASKRHQVTDEAKFTERITFSCVRKEIEKTPHLKKNIAEFDRFYKLYHLYLLADIVIYIVLIVLVCTVGKVTRFPMYVIIVAKFVFIMFYRAKFDFSPLGKELRKYQKKA